MSEYEQLVHTAASVARALHSPPYVPLFRAKQLAKRVARTVAKLARRGRAAAPVEPGRRRLVLLQIDGLSSRRLRQSIARGDMPHLKSWIESGQVRLTQVQAATPPSTPVFQAGLLYGAHNEMPGFGWYDRKLGRVVRMDLAEDVSALDAEILPPRAPNRPPLLEHGVSYGTIWPAGAAQAFFNVVLFIHGQSATGRVVRNLYDRALSTAAGAALVGKLVSRFALELGVGLWDFVRWCQRIRDTRFEWRFLYMRLFVSVIMRDVATQGAIIDILRGVPVIYIDYLGYDEYAHRRGPDSEMALYNLRGIDAAIARLRRAARTVPEYGYELYVFSDHGQSSTTPFERVTGRDLQSFVLEHAARGCVEGKVETSVIRELVAAREAAFWVRTLWRPLRAPMQLYVWWIQRRLQGRAEVPNVAPLDRIHVVSGGTIAHLYFERGPMVEEIEQNHPDLIPALTGCSAVGLVAGRTRRGPVVYYHGQRYQLSDRRALEQLEPFRVLGYDLLTQHLRQAVEGSRSGDLVLYGGYTPHGDVAYDFEFGSHGGISAEELDQFVVHPSHVRFPLHGPVRAEEFYQFFKQRYLDEAPAEPHEDQHAA